MMDPEDRPEALSPALNTLADNPHWMLALRVSAAPCFKKSARLREFLLYVCEKALTDQISEIREQQIGKSVFGRRPEYNAGEDNIVRVEARELRKRLDTYFTTDGRDEPVIISIPKGSYVPQFESRAILAAPAITESALEPESTPAIISSSDQRRRFSRTNLVLASMLLITVALASWFFRQIQQLKHMQSAETANSISKQDSFWTLMFNSDRQTYIVLSDTCWVLLQDFWHHDRSLRDYLSRQYMADLHTPEMHTVASRHFTDMADATILSEIVRSSFPYSQKLGVRSARALEVDDLKTQNLILVGSRRANPWVEQFDQQLPFTDEFDAQSGQPFYLNHSPRSGEVARFLTRGKDGAWEETYGAIAFLPNLGHSGNVLIIEGSVAEGTQAAGDYVCSPAFIDQLRKHLNLSPTDPIPHFELLLKISALAGSPSRAEYLTHRILPD
jgi:hypothetical protein